MSFSLRPAEVEEAFACACRMDVLALKPGNVSLLAPGHGMTAQDFLCAARVAAAPLAAPGATVGQRVLGAVTAAMTAVGCNTNLGIVLLAAPLAHAALQPSRLAGLDARVAAVLRALTVTDAADVYAAIRHAGPAGLGTCEDQDVRSAPTCDLRTVMGIAAHRDRVAFQYARDFADVFGMGVPAVGTYLRRWGSLAWAMTGCYLGFLATIPDSHVFRKYGEPVAREVMARARQVETVMKACEDPAAHVVLVGDFDRELKARGVNPGTSADLAVASVVAWLLDPRLRAKTGEASQLFDTAAITRSNIARFM